MRRVALVTYADLPSLSADDRLVLQPLGARGIDASAAAWDDPGVDWAAYDALVIRSTWNYHLAFDTFRRWLMTIESLDMPVWNAPALLRWNADKRYLRELSAAGVEVVPTRWVEAPDTTTLEDVLAETTWPEAVIKPAISASAYETWRTAAAELTDDDERRFTRLRATGTIMVQPFLPELAREGEWSLVFIAGEFSHAVRKRPRAGDFRVQHEHGGSAQPAAPPSPVVATARSILECATAPWLYARVDGVEIDGRFVLMELELLEPSLFLASDPRAPERFAAAIARAVGA
jgi:glutathione synthase/RimK-type ligase-like ATP-grasp enzyme